MVARLDDKRLEDVPRLKELYEGQLNEALTFYQRILDEGGPLDPSIQKDVAVAFKKLGVIQVKLGKGPEAGENLQRAAGLLQNLIARYPDMPEYRVQLANCYHALGVWQGFGEPTKEDDEWFQKELALCEQLCRDDADNPEWQNALAECYLSLGLFQWSQPKGQTRELIEKAFAIHSRLHERFPDESRYGSALAAECLHLGKHYEYGGQLDKAEAVYRQGEALLQLLIKKYPQETDYANFLVGLYSNWSAIPYQRRFQPEEAAALSTKAIALAEEILRREPRHRMARSNCVAAYGNRALAYSRLNRETQAGKDLDRAIELSEGGAPWKLKLLRGWNWIHLGEPARAVSFAQAIADDPTAQPDLLFEAAKIASVAGRNLRHDPTRPAIAGTTVALIGSALGQGPLLATCTLLPAERIEERPPTEQRRSQIESSVALALRLLRRIQQAGEFKDSKSREVFLTEDNFRWLQGHADFQKFRREIKAMK